MDLSEDELGPGSSSFVQTSMYLRAEEHRGSKAGQM